MVSGFDAFLSEHARAARDALSLDARYVYERARESLLDDPTAVNPHVTPSGDGYVLEYYGILLVYEFVNARVVHVFGVFEVIPPQRHR
jgi:hypothetical protein